MMKTTVPQNQMSLFRESADPERRSARWDLDAGFTNYLALVGGQFVSAVASFGAVWLVASTLGTDGYGRIVAFIGASQLVAQAAIQWTAISLFRHGCREFVDHGRIAASFWNRLAILAANILVVALAAPWLMPRLSALFSISSGGAALIVVHLLTTALATHTQQALQAAKLPKFQSLLQLAERGSLFLFLATTAALDTLTWWPAALAFAFAPLVSAVVATARLRKLIFPMSRVDPSLIREMLRFSTPLIFFSLIGYLTTNHLDTIFILHFLSPAELGVYSIAYQIAGVFMQLTSLLGSLFMAYFITADTLGDRERIERFFRSILPPLTLVCSAGAAFVAIAAALLLEVVFGAPFQVGRPALWPLLAAAAVAAPVTIGFGPATNARSRTSIAAIAAVVAALTNSVLNVVLIPRFGLVGCAWATTAAFGSSLVVFLVLSPRLVSAPRSWTLAATLPMLAAAVAGAAGREWSALALALATTAGLAIYHANDVRHTFRALATRAGLEGVVLPPKDVAVPGERH